MYSTIFGTHLFYCINGWNGTVKHMLIVDIHLVMHFVVYVHRGFVVSSYLHMVATIVQQSKLLAHELFSLTDYVSQVKYCMFKSTIVRPTLDISSSMTHFIVHQISNS